MAKVDPQQGLMPSILDRLADPDSDGTSWRLGYSLEQIVDAVRRDLEELLNAHQPHVKFPEDRYPELASSVFLFGMPDLVSFDPTAREQLGGLVERVISRFEPRLRAVRVALVETDMTFDRSVRFHVEAQINADPAPEVAFETVVELFTGYTSITASEPRS
jgi:type VI secretion system protein ImpF